MNVQRLSRKGVHQKMEKRSNINIHKRKDGIIIERINIEDIVQPSAKVEG
jgi:hypothetical protein